MKQLLFLTAALLLGSCSNNINEAKAQTMAEMNEKMYITIDGSITLTTRLANNSSTQALVAALREADITYEAHDYGGFEKVGNLGQSFPQNNTHIDTQPGDVILYQGNSLCLYYGENSWSFTRIGWIEGLSQDELKAALKSGKGNVSVRLSLNKTTAVHSVETSHDDCSKYISLNGTRLKHPAKGVYVKDGKKTIIRKPFH